MSDAGQFDRLMADGQTKRDRARAEREAELEREQAVTQRRSERNSAYYKLLDIGHDLAGRPDDDPEWGKWAERFADRLCVWVSHWDKEEVDAVQQLPPLSRRDEQLQSGITEARALAVLLVGRAREGSPEEVRGLLDCLRNCELCHLVLHWLRYRLQEAIAEGRKAEAQPETGAAAQSAPIRPPARQVENPMSDSEILDRIDALLGALQSWEYLNSCYGDPSLLTLKVDSEPDASRKAREALEVIEANGELLAVELERPGIDSGWLHAFLEVNHPHSLALTLLALKQARSKVRARFSRGTASEDVNEREGNAGTKPHRSGKRRGRGVTRDEADTAMMQAVNIDPDRMKWSARQWAQHVGCSTSTIHHTSMWTQGKRAREKAKAERMDRDRHRRIR